jgi:hypothetical protein
MSGQFIADMRTPGMNHPIVKKLLRNELLMWGLGVLVVVALPMGVVVLEATTSTSSSSKPASEKKKTTGKPRNSAVASKPPQKRVVVAEAPLFADSRAASGSQITDGILDPEAVFGSVAIEEGYLSTSDAATSVAIPSGPSGGELTEVSSETVGSGILYFGGGEPAGVSDEATLEVTVSEVEVASVPVVDEGVKTADLSLPDEAVEEADPDLIALMAAGEKPALKADGNAANAEASPEPSMKDDEEEEDTRERTQVTLLRPKGEIVKSIDDIIFRCRTQAKLFPFVLVRSRQKSAPWWVQNDTLRQGTYVRGRAQFGNRNTIDGSRFVVVVAFVEDMDDVPEPGTQLAEIPEGILISQELEFTLRK